MTVDFVLNAEPRVDLGKGASRRLRREGRIPAIVYGAGEPVAISLEHREVTKQLTNDAFYSHILTLKLNGGSERVILRDMHRHPYKPTVMHMDLQRVVAGEAIKVHVPLHFINENKAPGVKNEGGVISHLLIDVEVSCLPRHLPEAIEVDLSKLGMGESIHMSQLVLPEGVELVALSHGPDHDLAVVSIHHPRRAEAATDEAGEAEEEAEGEDEE